jgi:hypothetical protein
VRRLARCVPVRPVIKGYSRGFTDKATAPLSWPGAAQKISARSLPNWGSRRAWARRPRGFRRCPVCDADVSTRRGSDLLRPVPVPAAHSGPVGSRETWMVVRGKEAAAGPLRSPRGRGAGRRRTGDLRAVAESPRPCQSLVAAASRPRAMRAEAQR